MSDNNKKALSEADMIEKFKAFKAEYHQIIAGRPKDEQADKKQPEEAPPTPD